MPKMNPFKTTKTYPMFNNPAADVVGVVGQFVELGRIQIQAGEALSVGYDNFGGQVNANGRIFFNPQTAADALIPCTLRIDIETPKKRVEMTLFEGRSERLSLGATDPTLREPLPFIDVTAYEDYYIVLRANVDAAATFDKGKTKAYIDLTSWDVK